MPAGQTRKLNEPVAPCNWRLLQGAQHQGLAAQRCTGWYGMQGKQPALDGRGAIVPDPHWTHVEPDQEARSWQAPRRSSGHDPALQRVNTEGQAPVGVSILVLLPAPGGLNEAQHRIQAVAGGIGHQGVCLGR